MTRVIDMRFRVTLYTGINANDKGDFDWNSIANAKEITKRWYITCDDCGRCEEEVYLFETVLENLQKRGWVLYIKGWNDPSFGLGGNIYYYYCPECAKRRRENE